MADPGLRARVERLLRGDFRADDLTRLFLYARDRCDGRESVQEVGDFVAHHDERSKGIVTRATRDWFLTVQFVTPTMSLPIDGNNLPANFPDFLWASLRRAPSAFLRRDTGLSRALAERLLPGITTKLIKNPSGTLSIASTHTQIEIALIKALSSYFTAKAAFTDERLYEDFTATLKSHGLLSKAEMRAFQSAKAALILFAVSVMHNCTVILGDGSTTKLRATAHDTSTIGVMAMVPLQNPISGGQVTIASAMFPTELKPAEHCEPALLASAQPWEFDIELTPSGLLAKLG